ncbi:MAG: hypothetical protein J3Q66DRAFT_330752 [Benniella sp.]|nr:MAG: hypothetical protein J3Q66DRAFT_330752 [Benniella sp.]
MDNPTHRVLSVPELVVLIASFLSPYDTSHWMQTCRTAYRQLESTFWSHLNLTASYTDPSVLPRYRHHFRTIQVDWHQTGHLEALVEELPLFETRQTNKIELLNLKKLVLRSKAFVVKEAEMDAFVEVLSYTRNLTVLDIPGDVLHHAGSAVYFLEIIREDLPNLQRLAFSIADVEAPIAHRLLKVCFNHPQLVDLQCDFMINMFLYPMVVNGGGVCDPRFAALLKFLQDTDKKKADTGKPTGLRLKSLVLPLINGGYPRDFLFPFLRSHVPHLERLGIPLIHRKYNVQDLKDAILEGCPKLQHIVSNNFLGYEGGKCALFDVVRYCIPSGLRSFRGSFHDVLFKGAGSRDLVETLLEYHATTLEQFELLDHEGVSSVHINSVLAKCRRLRELRIDACERGIRNSWRAAITYRDAASGVWICHDIEVLYLRLDPIVTVLVADTIQDTVDQKGKETYAQIGRLVKLEELGLGCTVSGPVMKDLTLENGWLAELAGLKELRHFHMLTDFWTSMGQAEIEFMVANWPKLERISIDLEEDYSSEVEEFSKPHWQWLEEKRPYIVLTVNEWSRERA